jgi:hypothetical protein
MREITRESYELKIPFCSNHVKQDAGRGQGLRSRIHQPERKGSPITVYTYLPLPSVPALLCQDGQNRQLCQWLMTDKH